jgi:hypothetical protein
VLFLRAVIPYVVGCALLVAGALKVAGLLGERAGTSVLPGAPWVQALGVGVDVLLGWALIVGVYPRAVRPLTVVVFAAFACVSGFSLLAGRETCGCFGPVSVHPAYTLVLDLLVCAVVLLWKPLQSQYHARRAMAWAAVCVLSVGLWWIVGGSARTGAGAGGGVGPAADFGPVHLDPPAWKGQPFPLTPYLDAGGDLGRGQRTVVLIRRECGTCGQVLDRLGSPEYRPVVPDTWPVLVVEVPSRAEAPQQDEDPLPGGRFVARRLPADREWVGRTPVILWLSDGIVVRVFSPEEITRLVG